MWKITLYIAFTTVLIWSAVDDFRRRTISIAAPALLMIIGALWRITGEGAEPIAMAAVALFTLASVGVSKLTRGGIGSGDALLTGCVGVFLGPRAMLGVLLISLLFSAVGAMLLIILKNAGRKREMAFAPFLLIGYIVVSGPAFIH